MASFSGRMSSGRGEARVDDPSPVAFVGGGRNTEEMHCGIGVEHHQDVDIILISSGLLFRAVHRTHQTSIILVPGGIFASWRVPVHIAELVAIQIEAREKAGPPEYRVCLS